MVTKAKKDAGGEKHSRVRVGKLKLNKETVKDLGGEEAKQIKGGQKPVEPKTGPYCTRWCSISCCD